MRRFAIRGVLVLLLLGGGIAGKYALSRHLDAAGAPTAVPLAQPLETLPMVIGPWQGRDVPIGDERYLYADQHLQRVYWHPGRNQSLSVWMAYSAVGADRGHHPEICMAVAGKTEDPSVRQQFSVPGGDQPIQQYRFGRPGDFQWVYYWYYTMPAEMDERLDALQLLHQRMQQRPASMTIEVFAPERASDDGNAARQFVALLDQAIKPLLPSQAVRGSRRLPVTYVEP